MNLMKEIVWKFKGVSVMALVGESGTGKSFRAKLLAQKYAIDAIIDDGLLIRDDKIVAGRSAKKEKTFLGAVRIALFDDKEHRDEICKALKKEKDIKKILILGTSEKMVGKIAMRLQIPAPTKIIRIEDISTQDEIDQAIRSRRIEGKHVIPVPAIEIQQNYPQIFYNKVQVFLKRKNKNGKMFEKSVVRPEFSQKGRVTISEAALAQLVLHCVSEHDQQIRVKKMAIKTDAQGYRIIITIDVPFGTQLTGTIHNLQKYIIENIEKYTGILIEEVSIVIDKIMMS